MTEKDESRAIGGRARAKKLSPEDRKAIALKGAEARWGKTTPQAICEGPLNIGDSTVNAAVLPGEIRVLNQATFLRAIGRARSPKGGTGVLSTVDHLPFFLQAKVLQPFINNELVESTTPIFWLDESGQKQVGYRADSLPKVCEAYLKLRDSCALSGVPVPASMQHIVAACDILMRGLAQVGIIALVDEATGYQKIRGRHALEEVLEQFIAKELVKWTKMFPDDYYAEMFRLKGWNFKSMQGKRPSVVGKYTNDLIYERIAPFVLKELREKNPPNPKGQRPHKHFQWLTDDIGHPKLREHLASVIALMRACDSWESFKLAMNRALPKFQHTKEMF